MEAQDILTKFYFLTATTSANVSSAQATVLFNNALERLEALVNNADQRWTYDDQNQTDLPIATTALVAGQQDYEMSIAFLSIDRVEIMDLNGNWLFLMPIGQHDIRYVALEQYLKGTGTPLQYNKEANSIFLYPTPNYSQAASLQIYYTRGPVEWDGSTMTFVPGFNSLFHDLIAYWMAYEFAMANGKSNATQIWQMIQLKEQSLYDFYGQRSRDERPRMGLATDAIGGTLRGAQSGVLGYPSWDSNR